MKNHLQKDIKRPFGNSIGEFKLGIKIGEGAFAEVYKAKSTRHGYEDLQYAVKKIEKKKMPPQRIENEIKIHRKLIAPEIVKFVTDFEDDEYRYLVLEYCGGGSLEQLLKRRRNFSEEEACALIKQVIDGVKCLQTQQVIHRDLSLRNILLTEKGRVKIADFGLATKCRPNEKKTSMLGTANFMSPEIYQRDPYNSKADIWSVGCILYALLYGAPPFHDKNKNAIMNGTMNCELAFPNYATTEARELLMGLLRKDPRQRIDLKSALDYPFFKKYDKTGGKYELFHKRGDSGFSVSSSSSSNSLTGQKMKKISFNERMPSNYERKSYVESQFNLKNKIIAKHSMKEHSMCRIEEQRTKYPSNSNVQKSHLKNKIQLLPSRQEAYENIIALHRNSPEERAHNHTARGKWGVTNEINNEKEAFIHNDRSEYLVDVPVKSRPPTPLYPTGHMKHTEEFSNISLSHWTCYSETENSKSMQSKNMQSNCLRRSNSQDNFSKHSSCSHDYNCPSENCCHHHSSCPCHQHLISDAKNRNDSNGFHHSDGKKPNLESKAPLSTARLKPQRRNITKNKIVTILNDGQVCVEVMKGKEKYVANVCFISSNGKEITLYEKKKEIPKKKMLPLDKPPPLDYLREVQNFYHETLPEIHWKKYYLYAKKFVDIIRSKTPKVIVHGEKAKCIMMENDPNPDFEIEFYNDNLQITEIKGKKTIKNKDGDKLTDDIIAGIRIELLMNIFENMKEKCCKYNEICSSVDAKNFPVTVGRAPNAYLKSLDDSKENASQRSWLTSSLNSTMARIKSSSSTINTDCSPCANSSQPLISRLQTRREVVDTQIIRIHSSVPGFVSAKYSDGVQMWISTNDKDVFFLDSDEKRLDTSEHPELMKRYDLDLETVLLNACL